MAPRRAAWIVPVLFGLLAFLTRTRHPTFDSWLYSLQVESALRLGTGLAEPELWHPHHLAYSPLGALLLSGLRLLFRALPALTALQLLSSACAAGCLWALSRILCAARGPEPDSPGARLAAELAVLPMAFTFAFWYYAGEGEVYLPALFFACAGIAILVGGPKARWRTPAAACLLVASTLMHQMMVLLAVPVVAWSLVSPSSSPRSGLTLLILWGLGSLAGYVLVWSTIILPGPPPHADFGTWITYYMHTGARDRQGWGHVDVRTPLRALVGLARSVFGGHMVLALDPKAVETLRRIAPGSFVLQELQVMAATPRLVAWTAFASMLASVGFWTRGILRALRRRPPHPAPAGSARVGWLLGLWALSMALFILWWEPENPEFWLLALPGIVGWLAVGTRGRWNRTDFSLGLLTLAAAVSLGSMAPKASGPMADELQMFARAAQLPAERGAGRIWPGFADVFLPEAVLRPLWSRVPVEGALDSLRHDLEDRRPRIWILPDSVATRQLPGGAVRIDGAGRWSVWSLGPEMGH